MNTNATTPDVDTSSDPALLLACIADAGAGYRHAEMIVQQRLYNFLMAASILILASASLLASHPTAARSLFILTVSILGFILSCCWAVLGVRQRKFIDLHMEIIQVLENRLMDVRYRVWEPIAMLRESKKKVEFPVSKKMAILNPWQLRTRSSNLLFIAPIVFAFTFIILCGIAVCSF